MEERAVRHHLRALGIGPLIKNREWVNGPCPFAPYTAAHRNAHDAKVGFGVHTEKGGQSRYFCFTCKAKGTVYDLAAELGRLRGEDYSAIQKQAFRDELVSLSHYDDLDTEEDQLQDPLDLAAYGDIFEPAWGVAEARDYLQARGIGARTSRLLNIGWDGDEQRVVFPIKDNNGLLYGFSGRTILGNDALSPKYPKVRDYYGLPKRHLLLGEELVNPELPILIIEGLLGYARMHEIGASSIINPMALLGSEMTPQKAERLMRWSLPTYLLPDPDAAGDICLWGRLDDDGSYRGGGAVDKLKDEVPVYIPEYPEGVDDVDDLTFEDIEVMLRDTPVY